MAAVVTDRRPDQDALVELYASVGWTAYTREPERLCQAVTGSRWVASAWEGERLVGLCRAVGDGVSICYLQDVLVHPDCQRQGLGRSLVQACLDAHADVRALVLMTDDRPEQLAFYEALGLQRLADLKETKLNIYLRFAGMRLS